jgi:hypothetical protein
MPAKTWNLKRTVQCKACPWRKDVDPATIPDGYSVEKHRALASTIADCIADPRAIARQLAITGNACVRVMACHESPSTDPGEAAHCVGWLVNQLGPGNNIPLRLHVRNCGNIREIRTVGEQHERFEDTIPAGEPDGEGEATHE